MVKPELLLYELVQAGLPCECVDINGRIDYTRPLTPQEEQTAAAIIAAHDPNGLLPWEQDAKDYRDTRQAAIDLMTSGIQAWETMTGAQKQAWIGDHMDEIMRILRALIKFLT